MEDNEDAYLTDEQRKAALILLTEIGRYATIGTDAEEVTAKDLLKILSFMAGVVFEADDSLKEQGEFAQAGAYFGVLSAGHGQQLRIEHERDGFSAMDQVEAMAAGPKN